MSINQRWQGWVRILRLWLNPRVVRLRAERLGSGSGRIYILTSTATDPTDNTATATGTCLVRTIKGTDTKDSAIPEYGDRFDIN